MPKVEKLVIKILPTSSLISSMRNGEYDIYRQVLADTYKGYKDLDNIAVVGRQALYYQYLGFNLGHWDNEKKIGVVDPDKKMSDIRLRKAMAYAMNMDEVATQFYDGLREKANSPIPPVFSKYHDAKPRYEYNVEKANALLDEAGYKDIDGDGIREDKDGKPFVIYMAFPAYDIAQELSQQYIQYWAKVGLKVELATGRLMGSNFFPTIESNKGYDIFVAAWNVGTALELSGLYGKTAKFNHTRMSSDKNEELLLKTNSLEAIKDPEYKVKAIREWEENYMENVLGFLPILFKYELFPVNRRLNGYNVNHDSREASKYADGLTFIGGLTQKEPLAATK